MPWIAVAAVAAGVSAGVGAYSAISSAQAQSRISSYNATIATQNADLASKQIGIAKKQNDVVAAKYAEQSKKYLAAQAAGYAKAGVTEEGTPMLVAAESIVNANIDALAIRYAGTAEQSQILAQQSGLEQQATLEKMRGKMSTQAGYLQAGNSLLTGISSIARMK
jgi:hypothetical protein